MKKRTYKTIKYTTLFGIVTVLGVCFLNGNIAKAAQNETSYIITAQNEQDYKTLVTEYKEELKETISPFMEKEQMLVISADEETVKELENDTRITDMEEDVWVQGCNDDKIEEKGQEWNLNIVNIAQTQVDQDLPKVKVAVIDSGIDYSLDIDVRERKNFVPEQDEVSVLYEDATGHGTGIAGIIAAKDNEIGITGINSNVDLYSAKVLDSNNSAPVSRIVEAINWAIEKNVNILNLSFGTSTDSDVLHNAIKKAYQNNILIVAAAGNGTQIEYPAAYPETVAVGSIGTDGKISESSASGEEIELVAPGEQILSTGAFDGVMTCGGTSMAAPHVVGIASLLWEKDITVDAEFIRMLLDASAKTYENKQVYGYGLVDHSYANTIYDECKSAYEDREILLTNVEELQQDGILKKNTSSVDTEEYENVNYVEGLWTTPRHQDMASQSNKLSGDYLKAVKQGAIANDTYISGMTEHHQWHGYYKTGKAKTGNYVACYLYLMQMAQQSGTGNYTMPQPSYMEDDDYLAMKGIIKSSGFNGHSWSEVTGLKSPTQGQISACIYGIALHVATDTFAHSTFDLDGTYINHDRGNGNADKPTYATQRYDCAMEISRIILEKCANSRNGSASDFHLNSFTGTSNHDKGFWLKNISLFIQSVDPGCYSMYSDYFDKMNIS